jgi:hypothetical protein
VDGFYVNRRFWFLDGWIAVIFRVGIRACSGTDSVDTKKLKPATISLLEITKFNQHVLLNGRVQSLTTPMEHYAFPDIATFVEKHDRYSSWEVFARTRLHTDEKHCEQRPLEHRWSANAG